MNRTEEEKGQIVSNGPIFKIVDFIIRSIQFLSPVEWIKKGTLKIWKPQNPGDIRKIANFAIDAFISLKWAFLLGIWIFGITNRLAVGASIFLLIMNLHTYFWYHLWVIEKGNAIPGEGFRDRRRFVNFIFAISYSIALYGYLYHRVLVKDFIWPYSLTPWVSAIIFSIGNSLTGFSGDLKPISVVAHLIVSSQLLMSFIFVALLLSNSVPRPRG